MTIYLPIRTLPATVGPLIQLLLSPQSIILVADNNLQLLRCRDCAQIVSAGPDPTWGFPTLYCHYVTCTSGLFTAYLCDDRTDPGRRHSFQLYCRRWAWKSCPDHLISPLTTCSGDDVLDHHCCCCWTRMKGTRLSSGPPRHSGSWHSFSFSPNIVVLAPDLRAPPLAKLHAHTLYYCSISHGIFSPNLSLFFTIYLSGYALYSLAIWSDNTCDFPATNLFIRNSVSQLLSPLWWRFCLSL